MKIGFGTQLWLRDNHYENFPRMLDELALEGFDGFEMCYGFLYEWYRDRPAELSSLLEMHGLEFAAYYTSIGFVDEDDAAAGAKVFQDRCRFTAQIGGRNVLLDGGRKLPQDGSEEDRRLDLIAKTANSLGEYARSLGLTMAWHQHWGSIFEDEERFHRLMAMTDPALVRFCPDTGQLALCGFDVLETLRRYSGRISYVHLKDVSFAGRPSGQLWPGGPKVPSDEGAYDVDSRGRWVELGRGVVDFPAVIEILRAAGYDGWLVDDLDSSSYPARVSARACKQYINECLGIRGEREERIKNTAERRAR